MTQREARKIATLHLGSQAVLNGCSDAFEQLSEEDQERISEEVARLGQVLLDRYDAPVFGSSEEIAREVLGER